MEKPKIKKKKKKLGKIVTIYEMNKKGMSAKQIAEELKINERLVRSYLWRAKNPEAYKKLLKRYFENKRLKKEEEIKAAVKNSAEAEKKEKTET